MTTLSAADPDQFDLLDLVADTQTPLGQDAADLFHAACWAEALGHAGWVDPNNVRKRLLNAAGELALEARQFSALWSTACGSKGYLDKTERLVVISGAGSKHNGGKKLAMRFWRGWHA